MRPQSFVTMGSRGSTHVSPETWLRTTYGNSSRSKPKTLEPDPPHGRYNPCRLENRTGQGRPRHAPALRSRPGTDWRLEGKGQGWPDLHPTRLARFHAVPSAALPRPSGDPRSSASPESSIRRLCRGRPPLGAIRPQRPDLRRAAVDSLFVAGTKLLPARKRPLTNPGGD